MATGNAIVFRFEENNPTLRRYLNTAERAEVDHWQTPNMTWSIELHPMHLTGNPFYIRLFGNTDSGNVPKVDTRNKTASQYGDITKIANNAKLRNKGGLNTVEQGLLITFISNNWDHLSLIAQRYADGELAPPDPPPPTPRATTKPCTVTPQCTGTVPVVTSGKAACNVCYQFQ